jgi:hypothetical protein
VLAGVKNCPNSDFVCAVVARDTRRRVSSMAECTMWALIEFENLEKHISTTRSELLATR